MGKQMKGTKHKSTGQIRPASLTLKVISYICLIIYTSSYGWIAQLYMDNLRNAAGFFILFAILGLIISIPFYLIIYKTIPELKNKQPISKKWATCINSFALGLFFMTPSIASTIVKKNFIQSESCNQYKVLRKAFSMRKLQEYYFFVMIDGEEEKIVVPSIVWDTLDVGQSVIVCTQKGILGIEYINYKD
jgi:hypothetical protein